MPSDHPSRRRVLSAVVTASALVAGCSGTGPDGATNPSTGGDESESPADTTATGTAASAEAPEDGDNPTESSDASATATPTSDSATSAGDDAEDMSGELDLREANVVGVEFDRSGATYRFDVTLYHDDDGEDGYADWWQVETLDGEQLGRRTLLHAHSTAPFTRSESMSIPDSTAYVVVRGHDQTHGYGGQAMVVTLDTGDVEAVRQGPEPRDFSGFEPSV